MKHYAPNRCEPRIEALNFFWGEGGERGGGQSQGRCERRSEDFVKIPNRCERRSEVFVKIPKKKKKKLGGGGGGGGGGVGWGVRVDVNEFFFFFLGGVDVNRGVKFL